MSRKRCRQIVTPVRDRLTRVIRIFYLAPEVVVLDRFGHSSATMIIIFGPSGLSDPVVRLIPSYHVRSRYDNSQPTRLDVTLKEKKKMFVSAPRRVIFWRTAGFLATTRFPSATLLFYPPMPLKHLARCYRFVTAYRVESRTPPNPHTSQLYKT